MILYLKLTYKNLLSEDINQDLELRAKNTNVLDLYFLDENDALTDITGATIFLTIKNKPTDTDANAVLSKTVTSLTDPTNGNTEILITATDCTSLLGNYVYDLKIKLSDGKIYTVLEGIICFRKSITIRES